MSKKHRLAIVTWLDAAMNFHDHFDASERPEPVRLQSAGWLMKSDKTGVTLGMDYYETDGDFRAVLTIPRSMIERVQIVKH